MDNRNNFAGTANGVADAAETRLDHLKDKAKELVDQGQKKAVELKDKVIDLQQRARSRGGETLDKTTDLIKQHPIAAVGVAFGIGYLAMRLVRR